MHHYVYQIISMTPDENGVCKIYSGLRSCECEPENDDYMGSGHAILNAINKYGREKFMKLIIGKFSTREEAHDCETKWLEKQFKFHGSDWKRFKTFNYNLRLNENARDGFYSSPETRAKQSAANIGENHPNFGKQRPYEIKKKISESQTGKQLSDETKQKLSDLKIGENHHNFKGLTIGTNRDNKTIVFCGGKDMTNRSFNPSNISKVILGNRASHKGFTFTRSDDPIFLQQLLDTAEFVDEESKQIIQQFLQQ